MDKNITNTINRWKFIARLRVSVSLLLCIILLGVSQKTYAQGQTVLLDQNFNGSITGWTVVDGYNDNKTWFVYSAGSSNLDGTDFVMVDSDNAGATDMNEELRSPTVDASGYFSITLEFDQYFRAYTSNSTTEKGDVDIWDGSQWVNVYSTTTTTGAWSNPNHQVIDITSYANAGLRVRFHYYDANYDWYWAVDNVKISALSCPQAGFDDITASSPYHAGDTIYLEASDSSEAGGCLTPGFTLKITTDLYSDTENSITFYEDSIPFYEVPVGSVPENKEWTVWGEFFNPNATYSFDWCDSYPDGTFPYEIYDNMTGFLITSGTINSASQACQTITIGTLSGSSTFSGTSVIDSGNGQGVFIASEAGPGTYQITYCYDNDTTCSDCASQNITVDSLTANAGNDTTICLGSTIQLGGSPTALSGTAATTYQWSPAEYLNDSTIANPTADIDSTTTFTVIVTDSIFGTDTATITVTVNSLPVSNAGEDQSYCQGGSIEIGGSPSATGGTSPYSYSWSPTNGLSSATVANPTASTTQSTIYYLSVTDAFGCASQTDSIQITVYPNPQVDAGASDLICQGDSVFIGNDATGGTTPYVYLWSPSAGLSATDIAQPYASPSATTMYTVLVTDSVGCSGTDSVQVSTSSGGDYIGGTSATYYTSGGRFYDSGGSSANYSNNENYTTTFYPCNDNRKIKISFDLFSIQYHSTCAKDIFIIYNGPNTTSPVLGAYCGTGNPGEFTSTDASGALTLKFVSDASTTGTGWNIAITQVCANNPVANAGSDISICQGETAQLGGNPVVTGGTSPYSYSWTPIGYLDNSFTANPTAGPAQTTTYKLVVTDSIGCTSDTSEVDVYVADTGNVYVMDKNFTYNVSGGYFYDPGGPTGDYQFSKDYTMTLMPCDGIEALKVVFSSFNLEYSSTCSYDWLKIYNGSSTQSTLIGTYCGTNSPDTVISSDSTGALTFVFHSDISITASGWAAEIIPNYFPLQIDITTTNEVNHEDGSAVITVSGGLPPYYFIWNDETFLTLEDVEQIFTEDPDLYSEGLNPTDYYNNYLSTIQKNSFTNLSSGIYDCQIRDNSNLIKDVTITIGKEPVWEYSSNAIITDGTLLKDSVSGDPGIAIDYSSILSDSIGVIDIEINDSSLYAFIGLINEADTSITDSSDFVTSLRFYEGNAYLSEGGTMQLISNFTEGDIFKIKIENLSLDIYKNGESILTETLASGLYLQPAYLVYSSKALTIPSVFTQISPFTIAESIKDMDCMDSSSGEIHLSTSSSPGFSFDYNWSSNASSTNSPDQMNLPNGSYSVTITTNYPNGQITEQVRSFKIGYVTNWTEVLNLSVSNVNTISRSIPLGNDAGAASQNVFVTGIDFWQEYYCTLKNKKMLMLGLSTDNSNFEFDISSMTYGYKIKNFPNYTSIEILHEGTAYFAGNFNNICKYRIEKTGSQIKYYINEIQLLPGANFTVTTNADLYAKASLYSPVTTVEYSHSSVPCPQASNTYVRLQREIDGGYYYANDCKIRFLFNEEYFNNDGSVDYKIYQDPNLAINDASINTNFGENMILLDVSDPLLIEDEIYILEIRNIKNEIFYLRFKKNSCQTVE